MFEWLEREISAIKTPRFHVVDGPADAVLRDAVTQSSLRLPQSYRDFVVEFGNAKLYRLGRGIYQIGVFAGPREVVSIDGARVFQIGFHDDAIVYLNPASDPTDMVVFESASGSDDQVASNFEEWLDDSCAHARGTYGPEKWAEIVSGPAPFTAEEQALVEARRAIRWRVLGVDADGDHLFEVTNASCRTLPLITIWVRSKDRRLNGAVWLKIGDIGAGQTGIMHADCYKGLIPADEIEVFALPDPQPEDREDYPELRGGGVH